MADDDIGGLIPPRERDRRGVDAALLAVTKSLVGEVEKRAIAAEQAHAEFHRLEEKARFERVAAQERLISEQDRRYEERFNASQNAIREAAKAANDAVAAAFSSAKEAIRAAQEATQKAIDKSEGAQKETNQATFVTIDKLETSMAEVIPRNEANTRFESALKQVEEVKIELRNLAIEVRTQAAALGAAKATRSESTSTLRDNAGLIVALLALLLVLARDFFR